MERYLWLAIFILVLVLVFVIYELAIERRRRATTSNIIVTLLEIFGVALKEEEEGRRSILFEIASEFEIFSRPGKYGVEREENLLLGLNALLKSYANPNNEEGMSWD